MLLRPRSRPLLAASTLLFLLPAVALAIAAVALRRRARAELALPPMPRLPVRRRPAAPSSSRLRRLGAPAPVVALPGAFWDASEEADDPAEIPHNASPLVSQASQSAAGIAPGAFPDASVRSSW